MRETGPSILVVEDDDDVRETISALLIQAGFCVETAASGWEAIAVIEKRRFDIMVADITLPGGLDGLQMTRHVRMCQPELKCLFISGQALPVVCDPMLDDFIPKPFRPFELVGCVWKILRGNLPYPRLDIAP
jgi:DNA-binding response OmpR family regulator